MKLFSKILAAATVITLSACGTAPSASVASLKDLGHTGCGYGSLERNDGRLYALEQQIVAQVNAVRAANGLAALAQHGCISSVAYSHSTNMAKQHNMSHVLDGLDANARLNNAGIGHHWWGENIHSAWSTRNGQPYLDFDNEVATAMNFWLNSPGHRANILNPNYAYIGVGLSTTTSGNAGYFYATQVFMTE